MPTRLALMRDQVRYQPGSADAVFELAYEYFRLRNYNDAAIGFKRVLLTRPNDVEALNNYAVALYRTRRGDLARESLRRAGDLAAGHAVVQRNLGVVLDSQGRVADAVVAYAKAAKAAHEERKPKIESRARDARGYCLERLEKLDDAAREYDGVQIESRRQSSLVAKLEDLRCGQRGPCASKLRQSRTPGCFSQTAPAVPIEATRREGQRTAHP